MRASTRLGRVHHKCPSLNRLKAVLMPEIPKPFSHQPLSAWIVQLQESKLAEDRLRALQAVSLLSTRDETSHWATHSLRDADSMIRALASKLLGISEGPISTQAEAEIASLLVDADPDTRFEAARALLRKKAALCDRSIPVLLAFLDEEETQPLMAAAVINSLVEASDVDGLLDSEMFPRLQKWMTSERGEVREAVAMAFAKWPAMCESVTEQLLLLLDDSEPVVREKIAEALGKAGVFNEQIKSALQTASEDEDSEVARVAAQALTRLEGTTML